MCSDPVLCYGCIAVWLGEGLSLKTCSQIAFDTPAYQRDTSGQSQKKLVPRKFLQIQKVFTNPESFCDKFIIGWRISEYLAIQNIQIICKLSGWTGKCPDNQYSTKSCKTTFYAHLSRIWKFTWFTRFIRKVFATKILLSGKFSLFVTLAILRLH